MADGKGLYDWFDGEVKGDDVVDKTKYASCSQVVHHLGVLFGIGLPRAEIEAFVRRILEDTERMMGSMAALAGVQTLADTLDAMFAPPPGPDLTVIEGGKGNDPS